MGAFRYRHYFLTVLPKALLVPVLVSATLLLLVVLPGFLFPKLGFFPGMKMHNQHSTSHQPPSGSHRTDFQTGIVYPRWFREAYGPTDTAWQRSLQSIQVQTGARWIEIPVLFSQATSSSTTVTSSSSTPSVESLAAGIRAAHALGYHVFVVPLMGVKEPGGWSGSIQFQSYQQEQAWFESYWKMLHPYAQAAADNGAEQIAIATEFQWLQQHAPTSLWNQLIDRMRGVFKNTMTYDMNWSSLDQPMPDWLKNPSLGAIGVSVYIPLSDTPARVDPKTIFTLWRDKIKSKLDSLASLLRKPVLISEIGYRNSTDALYRTWEAFTKAAADPEEQAAAYTAALENVITDPQIMGTFFWGWDDVGRFTLKGQPAVQVLRTWYTSPHA